MEKKEKTAATFTVHRAGEMTPKGRKNIAKWLRHCADQLETTGKNYSKRFTAKYIY